MGLPATPIIRNQVKRYQKFFRSQKHRNAVKKLVGSVSTNPQMHLAVMAALSGCSRLQPSAVLRAVLNAGLELETNSVYQSFANYGADHAFWVMVSQGTGYSEGEDCSLGRLAIHLLLTASTRTMHTDLLAGLDAFLSVPHQAYREKWLLLLRMVPLVENNFNLCELGPRSTGKSHLYKEVSPNSILVSGGQTTVANLFYNMGKHTMGLVGLWDCVAFDEVADIRFKDKDGIQIMKDYMASGSFARGKEEKAANASMVFVGNINQSVDVLLKTSSLFDPFPPEMGTDTAFLDRIHCYLPGWEIPKFRPEHFTDDYGFITDYCCFR